MVIAARTSAAAASACAADPRVHQAERALRPDLGSDGRHAGEADGVVDPLVGPHAAAAHPDDREADRPRVLGGDEPRPGRQHRHRDLGQRQVSVRVLQQVGRPSESGHHAGEPLGGFARGQRALAGNAGVRDGREEPAGDEQLGGERHRHLVLAWLARVGARRARPLLADQVGNRLADLHGVAGGRSQHLVHVGEQGGRAAPRAVGHRHDALGERPGVLHGSP